MSVLVCGGAGYIGSHTVHQLIKNGEDVIIVDNLQTGHMDAVHKDAKFCKGDIRDKDFLRSVFKENDIEAVIHFAANSLVGVSMTDPLSYFDNNVYGTQVLLEVMVEFDVKKIVFSSTAATYGEPNYIPIDENHPQIPINAYGNSKLMVEKIMDDYDKAYGLKSVRLRYFNVAGADSEARIGEWHNPETHLIPNVLKADGNQTFKMFGDDYETSDGTCVRDYINVEDLADAHIKALEYLNNGGETNFFNLGTNDGNSVKEVFTTCEKITKREIPLEICPRREGDPAKLVANNNKAKDILGWTTKKSLEYSIQTADNWEKVLNTITLHK